MSKRFTDITKWERPWFRRLPPGSKLVFLYLLDRCDRAGFWEIDLDRMEFELGVSAEKLQEDCFPKLKDVIVREGVIFIQDFISFQYPGGLNASNKAHKGILDSLKKRLHLFKEAEKHLSPLEAPSEGALEGTQEKDKEKDKEKDTEKDTEKKRKKPKPKAAPDPDFDMFWEQVPNKICKQQALAAWKNALKKPEVTVEVIMAGLPSFQAYEKKRSLNSGYTPLHPSTWLNQERWEDQVQQTKTAPEKHYFN